MINLPTTALRRAGGRNVLQTVADVCLVASMLFWLGVMWVLLAPAWPTSAGDIPLSLMRAAFAIVLALCWSLVLPVLITAIAPNTSAGMLLQQFQRKTYGFMLMVGAAAFLLYWSYVIMVAWWGAQPIVVEQHLIGVMTYSTLIFFVVVPSWSWSASTPGAWLVEVQAAHAAEKLRQQFAADLALARESHTRALIILQAGLDHATLDQRQYVAGVINGMHRAIAHNQQLVARSVGDAIGVEYELPGMSADYVAKLEELEHAIKRGGTLLRTDYEAPRLAPAADVDSRSLSSEAPIAAPVSDSPMPSESAHDRALAAARAQLGGRVFTKRDIASVLQIEERTAQRTIAIWRQAGAVVDTDRLGRYTFAQ